jgi:hypothetical protein
MARDAQLLFLSILLFFAVTPVRCSVFSQYRSQVSARVTESIPEPLRWKRTGRAEDDTIIDLQIGLKHGGFNELERKLYEGKLLIR